MALSVTGAFSNINAVQRLNAEELRLGISGEASWHHQYRDSCYIYISGLDPRLTEGDVAIVFSQWGEPIDIVLVRDQKTGIPRGFGFVGYEDQRSTILAVDNANGMKLLQRTLRVDHCKDFRPPTSGEKGEAAAAYQPTGAEGGGINKHLITKRERELHQSRQQQKKLQDQRQQHDLARAAAGSKDVDEMWAEEFELMLSNLHEKADAEVKDLIRTDKRLKKKLKKEKKLLKKAAKRRASCSSSNSSSSSRSRSNSRKRSRTRQCEPPEKQTGEQEQRYTNATTSSSSRQPDANDSSKTSAHTSSSSSSGSSSRRHHGSREADERSSSRHAKSEEDVKREKAEEDRHSTDKSGDRDREKRRSSRRSRSRHRA